MQLIAFRLAVFPPSKGRARPTALHYIAGVSVWQLKARGATLRGGRSGGTWIDFQSSDGL